MAETIMFDVPVPVEPEVAAARVNWYDSIDGITWGTIVDSALISSLSTDPASGKKIWTSSAADPTKYHTIRSESALGIVNPIGPVLPPRNIASFCEIYADLRDFGAAPVAGIRIKMAVKSKKIQSSVVTNAPYSFVTDASGIARVTVMQGLTVLITSDIIGNSIQIDTTGKSFINVADYVV